VLPGGVDRRQHIRTRPASLKAVVLPFVDDIELVDISARGVLLASTTLLQVGQRAQLRLLLDREPVVASVEIVRVEDDTMRGREPNRRRYGARFIAVDEKGQRAIQRFLHLDTP
jgi:c-di-GMP-binding flagellar brake protein YcgR